MCISDDFHYSNRMGGGGSQKEEKHGFLFGPQRRGVWNIFAKLNLRRKDVEIKREKRHETKGRLIKAGNWERLRVCGSHLHPGIFYQ